MTYEKAKEAIECNYPPERYSMLREALDISMELLDIMKELEKGIADIEDTLNDAYTVNELCMNKIIHEQPMSEFECIAESFSLKVMQNLGWLLGNIKRRNEDG